MLPSLSLLLRSHPKWTLGLVTVAALIPFIGKPFNMDDPLFIWAAHQIQAHPANPYGFNVEWGWHEFPMWNVTENPPLTSYYMALAAGLAGWSEIALHAAFLLPAVALILGTFRLAGHFCESPMLAAFVTLFAPVLLVSSTTVMCDVPMLAFWVWTLVFWVEGTEQKHLHKLLAAGCLATLAELTKYYGICLLPLLAAYSLMAKQSVRQWAPFLLIPAAIFCAYQFAMHRLYGFYPLFGAADYGLYKQGSKVALSSSCLVGLSFTGGCVATALFLAPLLWKKRSALLLAAALLIVCLLFLDPAFLAQYPSLEASARLAAQIQLALWAATGLSVFALVVTELKARLDAQSVLLALWVVGTFVFAAFLNWTINARTILPMTPAVGILMARRLEGNFKAAFPLGQTVLCVAFGAALALSVTAADCFTAIAVRQNARSVCTTYAQMTGRLWFQGHWGFQYYMSLQGASPLDFKNGILKPGDLVIVPSNNTNVLPPAPDKAALLKTFSASGLPFLATMNQTLGASFYASTLGPLPFAFGSAPPEEVFVYVLR